MLLQQNVSDFFKILIDDLNYRPDTKAYIVGMLNQYKNVDCFQDNAGMLYCQARQKQNFANFQTLADGIFFTQIWAPQYLAKFGSKDYYNTIARSSYYACYRLINKTWLCYEQIADEYIELEYQIRERITNLQSQNNRIFLCD